MSASQDPTFSCLLMDDDHGFASMLATLVREQGGQPVHCASVTEARAMLSRRGFDLAVIDNRLPDGTGYEFFPELRRRCPDAVVMMITGAPELAKAVELTRNGLFDYLTKPLRAEDFSASLQRARLRLSRPDPKSAGDLIGRSSAMRTVLEHLQQAARHPGVTVLLLGETGTGKDLAARVLHRMSYPKDPEGAPYIPLNCSAVPAEMFESELFGSDKGSFTGSDRKRAGLVGAAEGGTLFLDEVAEIPLVQQAKLLRFLESREYRPLGTTTPRQFTGRIVAATHRDLAAEVVAGRFREDLMYRLDVMGIRMPALRERPDDIPALTEAMVLQLATKYGRRTPLVRPEDLATLSGHHFPGNVRELRNLLERSLLKTPPESSWMNLDIAWLRQRSGALIAPPPPLSVVRDAVPAAPVAPVPSAPVVPLVESSVDARTVAFPKSEEPSFEPPADRVLSPLELQEYQLIARVLLEERGGIRRAALRLGLTHQALLRRLQKWPELRPAQAS
jgi:DNA-binding NtrC family response regulator